MQDDEGYVLFVRKNALQILLPRYGLECPLYLTTKDGKSVFSYDEDVSVQIIPKT